MGSLRRSGGLWVFTCIGSLLLLSGLDAPGHRASGAESAAAPAGAILLRPQLLRDPVLDMDAYSVLVPENWKMAGALRWAPRMPSPYWEMSVYDPSQKAAWRQFERLIFVDMHKALAARLRQFPGQRAFWEDRFADGHITDLGTEMFAMPATPREYVLKILVPRALAEVVAAKDVAVVSETEMPEYAKAHTLKDPFHRHAKATRFRINYTMPDGPPPSAISSVEREFICTITDEAFGGADGTTMWIAEVTSYRAPKGKLDALLPTMLTIESSVSPKLPWFNAMVQIGQMFLQKQRDANAALLAPPPATIQNDENARHQAVMRDLAQQSSGIVSDSIKKNFANEQAGKAAVQQQVIHYINNTTSYTNPNDGKSYTVGANHPYQYINNRGEILQTDDARYQPPADPRTSWTKMEKTN